jgi:hypothetical protein
MSKAIQSATIPAIVMIATVVSVPAAGAARKNAMRFDNRYSRDFSRGRGSRIGWPVACGICLLEGT